MLRKTFIRFILITMAATATLLVLAGIRYNHNEEMIKNCCSTNKDCDSKKEQADFFILESLSHSLIGFTE